MSGDNLRTLWLVAILVVAAGGGVLVTSGTVAADTVTVGNDSADDYGSIQAAVDNATPGDTVRVDDGTYGETVVVTTSDLRIVGTPTTARGAPADAPVLDNSSGDVRQGFNAAFFVEDGADDVTIEGFEIRNYQYGLVVDAAGSFSGTAGSLANTQFRSNTLRNTDFGILAFAEGESSTLTDLRITGNDVDGSGLTLYALNEGTVQGATVVDNRIDRETEGNGVALYATHLNVSALGFADAGPGSEAFRDVSIRENDVDTGQAGGARDTVQFVFHHSGVGDNVTAANNTLSNTSTGFLLEGNGTYDGVKIVDNHLQDLNNGVKTRPATGNQEGPTNVSGVTFAENHLGDGIDRGISHPDTATGVLDASRNYWNASDGPSGAYSGSGVPVSQNVTVEPYYTDAAMTQLSVQNLDTGASYPTIQAGVDDASPGDTLAVHPGTYRERVTIDVPNLTLQATAGPRPVLNSTDGPVLSVAAPGVTVDGLAITGATGDGESGQGVDVTGDSANTDDVVLRNLTVRHNEDRGLVVDYTDNATLENIVVRENYDATETGDTPEDGWESNDDADGITLWYTNQSRLSNVVAVDNGDNGVYVNGNRNVLRNVTAVNNGDEGLDVSTERVVGGVSVDGLVARDNAAAGMELEGTSPETLVQVQNASLSGSPVGLHVRDNNQGSVAVRDLDFEDNAVHVRGADTVGSAVNLTYDAAAAKADNTSVIYGRIQPAIDASDTGEVVRFAGGPVDESVDVTVPNLTIRGIRIPQAEGRPTINGSVELAADGTAIRNVTVTRGRSLTPGGIDPHGILATANNTAVRNTVVSDIVANSTTGSVGLNGIQVFGGQVPVSNVTVRNNTVRRLDNRGDSASWPYGGIAGIKVQGNTADVSVVGNEVHSLHSAGWAYGIVVTPTGNPTDQVPSAVTITGNRVTGVNDGSVYDVSADPDAAPFPGVTLGIDGGNGNGYADASAVTLRRNVLAGSPLAVHNKDPDHELNATRNYWGSSIGPSRSSGSSRPAAVGTVDASPYYPTPAFETLRYDDRIPLSLTANETTVTAGDRVAFTLTDAAVDEPINGTVTVGERTKTTGADGTVLFELTATGTTVATGEHPPTDWNAFEADNATVEVESADTGDGGGGDSDNGGGDGGTGGGGSGGSAGDAEATTTTPTTQTPTTTPTSTQTATSTPGDDDTTSGETDESPTVAPSTDATQTATEPGGFGLTPLVALVSIISAVTLGVGLLRWRGWL